LDLLINKGYILILNTISKKWRTIELSGINILIDKESDGSGVKATIGLYLQKVRYFFENKGFING